MSTTRRSNSVNRRTSPTHRQKVTRTRNASIRPSEPEPEPFTILVNEFPYDGPETLTIPVRIGPVSIWGQPDRPHQRKSRKK